jgi:hypothetical protein
MAASIYVALSADASSSRNHIMWQSNCLALPTDISLGTPNRHIMFYQKNLFSPAAAILTRGFASIHFVKYYTATIANL